MPSISFCRIEATGFWFIDILRAEHYRAARLIRLRVFYSAIGSDELPKL